ncbi:MAG: phage/plasmid primase, P4 family [Veillonella sp.]|uniref:DNA primase family protein n=1 Tax=Veillonella sp. TaxID=1926307 RepID=UPI002910DD74|nr:phage/plasmid primase, P4 family [Veillonella sp.]MDU5003584.1 phage/plasmid primase, P4 family [Veillonella sp.]
MGKKVKADTWEFTNEKGAILPKKLGEYIKERYNIVHIKQTDTMTRNDALTTPLYGYNKKYGVYEALDVNGDAPLHNMIFNITDDIEIPSGKMSETLKYIKATAPVLPFIDTNIIAFKNALYDVENDAVLEKDHSIVTTTRMTNVEYNPDKVEHDQLDTFMFNLFGGQEDDADMMRFIYEVVGYCLVNNTFAQKFFILYGEGGNGKSSFLQLLTSLLTESNVSNIALIDIGASQFRLAEIVGKYANIGDDIESTDVLNTASLKKIVTGDTIIVEPKHLKPYSYKPHAKLFFSCNSIPRIYDTSTGMKDRLVIIPMTNRIRNTAIATPHIVREIINSGGLTVLLNRALEGLRRLRSQGAFTEPPRVTALTLSYIKENDQVAQFLDDIDNGEVSVYGSDLGCDEDINILQSIKDVRAKELYDIYKRWTVECGYKRISKPKFSKRMKALGYTNEKTVRGKASTKPYKAWQLVTEK